MSETISSTVTAGLRTKGFGNRIRSAATGPLLDTNYLPGTDVNPTISYHGKKQWKTGVRTHQHNHHEFARYGKGRVVVTTVGTAKPRTSRHKRLPMSEPIQGKLNAHYEGLRTKKHDNSRGSGDANAGTYIY